MQLYDHSGPAELSAITAVRAGIDHAVACCRQPLHVTQNLQLLACEALANIVEHTDPPATQIQVQLQRLPTCFELTISSDGGAAVDTFSPAPFDLADAIGAAADVLPSADQIGGRGLFLIGALADTVTYQAGAPNRLVLTYRIDEQKRHLLMNGRDAHREVGPSVAGYELIVAEHPAQIEPLRAVFAPVAMISLNASSGQVTITGLTPHNAAIRLWAEVHTPQVQRVAAIVAALGDPATPLSQPASA